MNFRHSGVREEASDNGRITGARREQCALIIEETFRAWKLVDGSRFFRVRVYPEIFLRIKNARLRESAASALCFKKPGNCFSSARVSRVSRVCAQAFWNNLPDKN